MQPSRACAGAVKLSSSARKSGWQGGSCDKGPKYKAEGFGRRMVFNGVSVAVATARGLW